MIENGEIKKLEIKENRKWGKRSYSFLVPGYRKVHH
jgi:hypothetical protein